MVSNRRTVYQWHPEVHHHWAREQLYFWRLAFSPTYDRERIVGALRTAFELHGATAYTVYELFAGGYDVFVRVWLRSSQGAFENDLHQLLGQYTVVSQSFLVNKIIVHWPWETEPGALDLRAVSPQALRHRLTPQEISRINAGELGKQEREEYEQLNLIAPIKRKKGIKFFTVISAHQQAMTTYATQRLELRIREVLGAAQGIQEKSLYRGVGFGHYLLMGRVADYFAIERELTEPLNAAVDPTTYGARTTTFPVSRPDFLDYRYDLKVDDDAPTALSAAEALQQDESQTLEVKGSAFASLDRWLRGDGVLEYDDQLVDRGVLKAVTALLNSDGGTVLIGALERTRFDSDEKLVDCPRRGPYVVLGIEADINGDDWDRYERRLRVLFEKRVRPDPNRWLSISRDSIDGRSVAMLTVRPGKDWFYHYAASDSHPHFWVREGARTTELTGPESDVYRRERSR